MKADTPRILIVDHVGLAFGPDGKPDPSAVQAHIESCGAVFHVGSVRVAGELEPGRSHFFYLPALSTEAELVAEAADGAYDAVIAAATFLPAQAQFACAGVRIGAGTGNMGSASWGGPEGRCGPAALMNTPGVNARATAQMVMKALLRVRPDLPVDELDQLVKKGAFDTGRDLARYPTAKLEGRVFAILGYGAIGREVAKLARAFGMQVRIFARDHRRKWIESEGFVYAATPVEAARGADVLSVHLGLGPRTPLGFANAGLIGHEVLNVIGPAAIVINFDRGELVDVPALGDALRSGRVTHAAVDADLFLDASTGVLSGSLLPYLSLVPDHGDKLTLLPHAAADTDHPTRVEGAIQAVNQCLGLFRDGVVHNLKGHLPAGAVNNGMITLRGIGAVTTTDLHRLSQAPQLLTELRSLCDGLSELSAAIEEGQAAGAGEKFMLTANRLSSFLREYGLEGPFVAD